MRGGYGSSPRRDAHGATALGIAIGAMLLILVAVFGCASAPPDRVALDSLQIMKATADSAMRVCAAEYTVGRLTEAQKATAIAAYDKFSAAAISGAFALQAATSPADAAVVTKNVTDALTALLNALRAFGVKGV